MLDASFDQRLAEILNNKFGRQIVDAIDLWPACRVLSECGIVNANGEDVAVAKIGPFVVATSMRAHEAAESFVRNTYEAIADFAVTQDTVTSLIPRLVLFGSEAFAAVYRQSAIFQDKRAWQTLLAIRKYNAEGVYPTIDQISAHAALSVEHVTAAVELLMSIKTKSGLPLIAAKQGGLASVV